MKKTLVKRNYIDEPEDIEAYVTRCLDGVGYDGGALEAAEHAAYSASKAVARLVAILFEKGMLTLPEVSMIAQGYNEDLEVAGTAETEDEYVHEDEE